MSSPGSLSATLRVERGRAPARIVGQAVGKLVLKALGFDVLALCALADGVVGSIVERPRHLEEVLSAAAGEYTHVRVIWIRGIRALRRIGDLDGSSGILRRRDESQVQRLFLARMGVQGKRGYEHKYRVHGISHTI